MFYSIFALSVVACTKNEQCGTTKYIDSRVYVKLANSFASKFILFKLLK